MGTIKWLHGNYGKYEAYGKEMMFSSYTTQGQMQFFEFHALSRWLDKQWERQKEMGGLDKEVIALVNALNKFRGIRTIESKHSRFICYSRLAGFPHECGTDQITEIQYACPAEPVGLGKKEEPDRTK